ncbi:MAG: hypothetical protein K0U93_10720 [Gammaproteobacteria bacterium]|nr:hypothetical protein [Gammaproteobacteria bacterium]
MEIFTRASDDAPRFNLLQMTLFATSIVATVVAVGFLALYQSVSDIGNAARSAQAVIPVVNQQQRLATEANVIQRLSLILRFAPTREAREAALQEIRDAIETLATSAGERTQVVLAEVMAAAEQMSVSGRVVGQLRERASDDEQQANLFVNEIEIILESLGEDLREQLAALTRRTDTGDNWTNRWIQDRAANLLTRHYLVKALLGAVHALRYEHLRSSQLVATDELDEAAWRFERIAGEADALLVNIPLTMEYQQLPGAVRSLQTLAHVFQTRRAVLVEETNLREADRHIAALLAKLSKRLLSEAQTGMAVLNERSVHTVQVTGRTATGLLVGSAALLSVLLALVYLTRRVLLLPLTQASKALEAMRVGSERLPVDAPPLQEFHEIARSIDAFADAVDEIRSVSEDAARAKGAVDRASVGLTLLDANGCVTYMNESAQRVLVELSDDTPENAFVASVAGPDGDLSRVRGIVLTKRETLVLDDRTFSILWTPVSLASGEHVGTICEWTERTDEVAVQREVQRIVSAAEEGDLSQRIEIAMKDSDFARLSSSINALLDVSERAIGECARVFSDMAAGDLNRRMLGEYRGAFAYLQGDINRMQEVLRGVISQFIESATVVRRESAGIASGNASLSTRTDTQLVALKNTASQMESMTQSVRQTAKNASKANRLATEAQDKAKDGGNIVGDTIVAMREIDEASTRIESIIGSIDEIAFQTNLLALNAAVEAARAGEHGRGFAVVASEVRNLAQRSATAAREIKALITDSMHKVATGTRLVDQSGRTLEDIVAAVAEVNAVVAEISAASEAQASGIDHVNSTVVDMEGVTMTNAQLIEHVATASADMQRRADQLTQLTDYFQLAAPTSGEVPERGAA